MPSGTFYLENTQNLRAKVDWYTSGSRVYATLYAKKINATQPTTITWEWEIRIGNFGDGGSIWSLIGLDYVEIASFSRIVSSDTVEIYAKIAAPSSSGSSVAGQTCEGSETVTIKEVTPDPEPETPDPSAILTAQDTKFGDLSRITWVPNAANLYFKLVLSLGGQTKTDSGIYPNSTSLVTYNIRVPYDFINAVSSGLTASVTVTLTTHSSSACNTADQIGAASAAAILCTIPDNEETKPTVSGVTFGPSPDPFAGAYIQSKTGIQVTAVAAEGKYGATISSTFFRLEGKRYDVGTSSEVIAQFGDVTLTAFAVDSRGFTSVGYPVVLNALPYSKPKLRPVEGQYRVTAIRCDSEGVAHSDGAYLIIMAKREYSPVVYEGSQHNYCSIRFRYKPDTVTGWSDWTQILAADAAEDSVTTLPLLGTLDPQGTYQIDIQAVDTLESVASTIVTVASDEIYDHADGALGSYGFGKFATMTDVFDIASTKTFILRGAMLLEGDAYRYLLDLMHPIGSVLETVNNTNPGPTLGGSWILAESTEVSTKWRRTE